MDRNVITNWINEGKSFSSVMPYVVFNSERKDIPLPFGVRDIYRAFVLSKLDKEPQKRREINTKLELFAEEYPDTLFKIFTKSSDLEKIKRVYIDALKKMEKVNAYQEIINTCDLILPLLAKNQADDSQLHYDILCALGKAWFLKGFFKKSIDYYIEALEIAIRRKSAESTPFGWIGVAYFNLSQYNKAIDHLQKAHWIAKTFKEDKKLECFWLGSLGNAFRGARQYPEAMECYEHALYIAKEIIKDPWNESLWQNNIGNLYDEVKQPEKAEGYYNKAIEIAMKISDKRLEARWKNNLGNIYAETGKIDEAIKIYEEAFNKSEELGDQQNMAICANNLANKYYSKGNIEKAIYYSKKALEIVINTRDRQSEKSYLNTLLNIYSNSGQLDKVIQYLQQQLVESKGWGNREDEEMWLGFLGQVYQLSGQYDKAKNYYTQANRIAMEIDDYDDQVRWHNALVDFDLLEVEQLYSTGKINTALEKCNNLIIHLLSKDLKEMIKPLCEAFRNKYPFEQLDAEITNIRNEIKNNPSDIGLHSILADCYARKGDLGDAILEYKKAIELKDPPNILAVLSMMEVNVWRGYYQEAMNIYYQWRDNIELPNHKVIASWIICTALALEGKLYEDESYIGPLLDMEINLSETHYSCEDILLYFDKLLEKDFNITQLINAVELYKLFINHFRNPQLETAMNNFIQGMQEIQDKAELPPELNVALSRIVKEVVPTIDSPLVKAYMKRGLIYRMLNRLNIAIKDYITAVTLNPVSDAAYMAWGACLAQKGELKKAIPKYGMSVLLNPRNNMAILGKMETEICIGKYSDAISTYEILKDATLTPQEEVIATFLLCLSLALESKPYEDYIDPLLNVEVKLSEKHDWCNVEIDRHLAELEKKLFDTNSLAKAKEIQALFKKHFIS